MSHLSDRLASRFYAYMSLPDQVLNAGVVTTIRIDTILFDSMNEFNIVTNSFTPRRAGYYLLHGSVAVRPNALADMNVQLYIEPLVGFVAGHDTICQNQNYYGCPKATAIVYLDTTIAYRLRVQHDSLANQTALANRSLTCFEGHRIS